MFDEVVIGALAGKTRVLTTSDPDWMARCHRIIVMRDGRIHADGAYEDLVHSDDYFIQMLKI